jgi:HSP20 family protein
VRALSQHAAEEAGLPQARYMAAAGAFKGDPSQVFGALRLPKNIELAGMRKEDLRISVDRGRLCIRGEKRSSEEGEARHYHLMERAFGRFERSISLPPNIDAEGAEVSYQDGVITAILPKTQSSPPTQLSVR